MNFIFCIVLFIGTIIMLFVNPNAVIDILIGGANKTIDLCLKLIAIYAIWLGILEIAEQTGITKKLSKLLKPIIKKLFGKTNDVAEEQIAINVSSNMLGLGNASTPSGILAMQALDKKDGKINKEMAMLMILNTCTLQIIPSTIIGLRLAQNSQNASDIILPTIIVSLICTSIGILLVKLLFYRRNKK